MMSGEGMVTRRGKLVFDGEVLRFERYTGDWMPSWGTQFSVPIATVTAEVLPGRLSLLTVFSTAVRRRLRIRVGEQERLFVVNRVDERAAEIQAAAQQARS